MTDRQLYERLAAVQDGLLTIHDTANEATRIKVNAIYPDIDAAVMALVARLREVA